MNKYQNRIQLVLFLGLTAGLAATALTHAAQAKDQLDPDAEAKQAAQEDADQTAEVDKSKRAKFQHVFYGTFGVLSDDSQKLSPDVVGSFATNASDKKSGRTYLVKVENESKAVLAKLQHFDGKSVQVIGKLRVVGTDGEAKYLIVSSIVEASTTPRAKERRSLGGL